MTKLISTILFCVVAVSATAQNLSVTYVAKNAVRVRYAHQATKSDLPDWLYVSHDELKHADITAEVSTRLRMNTSLVWDSSRMATAMCVDCRADLHR